MHNGIKMILRDVSSRSTLHYRFYLGFFVEIVNILLAVDEN